MSELAGVLTFMCVIVWLGLAGYALARGFSGVKEGQFETYFCCCILLAPMMAAAVYVDPPKPKPMKHNTP